MNKIIFKGSCVALLTPFKNDKIDFDALKKLIEFQIKGKTSAILVCGTTGEPATMTNEEKIEVIKFAKKQINGRAKLIVGTGGNNTKKVIEDSLQAKNLGADALLLVTPYYNKCTQNGLIEHFNKILDAVKFPIILYNVPGRTGVNMLPKTIIALSKNKFVCGIKEASGNIEQICELCIEAKNKLAVYSGDDSLNFVFLSLGAFGAISVTANVLPKAVSDVCSNLFLNKLEKSKLLHEKLFKLNKALFLEVNPIPVKAMASELKLCENEIRLPLTKMETQNLEKLKEIFNQTTKEIKC